MTTSALQTVRHGAPRARRATRDEQERRRTTTLICRNVKARGSYRGAKRSIAAIWQRLSDRVAEDEERCRRRAPGTPFSSSSPSDGERRPGPRRGRHRRAEQRERDHRREDDVQPRDEARAGTVVRSRPAVCERVRSREQQPAGPGEHARARQPRSERQANGASTASRSRSGRRGRRTAGRPRPPSGRGRTCSPRSRSRRRARAIGARRSA